MDTVHFHGFEVTASTMAIAMILVIVLLAYVLTGIRQRRGNKVSFKPNYPPGPRGWPLIGNLLSFGKEGWVRKQAQIYGDVFTLRMGSLRFVHLSGKTLKDALNNGHLLSERAPVPAMFEYYKNRGLVGASFHDSWREQRTFMIKTMKTLTFSNGRDVFKETVMQEVERLVSEIGKQNGQPISIEMLLKLATTNIMCSSICGRCYEYNNASIIELLQTMMDCFKELHYGCAAIFFPKLKHIPGLGLQGFFQKFEKLLEKQKIDIGEHKAKLDRENPTDFIDHYLIEIERFQKEGKPQSRTGFTEENLGFVLADLFMAGTETSATTLQWSILMLLLNLNVLEKVQRELDSVINENYPITMADQPHCPYTQAVIYETQRYCTIAPTVMRALTVDAEIGGYQLPKSTIVMANFLNCHHDETLWKDPLIFNPERFLSQDTSNSTKSVLKQEYFLPFATGRRNCPGKHLAKIELFLILANIVSRFQLKLPSDCANPSSVANCGFTRTPKPFKVCFVPRSRTTTPRNPPEI